MRSEKAFTLVEVILAIGVFGIVAIPIISMFLDGIRITSKSENTSEAYAYAQQYVEKLKGGEIGVIDGKTEKIPGTEYTYLIDVLSTTEAVVTDGEDFYKYMNSTASYPMTLTNSGLNGIKSLTTFDTIKINESNYWKLMSGTNEVGQIVVGKSNVWLQYPNRTSDAVLMIDNQSGKELNIYLQSNEANKNKLKIKNIGGIINVYGPVTEIPEKTGRKKIANVVVTVKNTRTGEHADLTANVTYYE